MSIWLHCTRKVKTSVSIGSLESNKLTKAFVRVRSISGKLLKTTMYIGTLHLQRSCLQRDGDMTKESSKVAASEVRFFEAQRMQSPYSFQMTKLIRHLRSCFMKRQAGQTLIGGRYARPEWESKIQQLFPAERYTAKEAGSIRPWIHLIDCSYGWTTRSYIAWRT